MGTGGGLLTLRAHVLQHVPHEGPGIIAPWLERRGHTVSYTRFFADPSLPDPARVDFLVIMGGPMSVRDEAQFPWLADEKQFVRAVIDNGRPVLGVCLGAQLIAASLGAAVHPCPEREIGWFPVEATPAGSALSAVFPPSVTVFHWHGETFDLPPGTVRLARSAACANQAFSVGERVVGLQFHLEVTPDTVRGMVEHGRNELAPGRFVQEETEILAVTPARYGAIHGLLARILERFVASIAE